MKVKAVWLLEVTVDLKVTTVEVISTIIISNKVYLTRVPIRYYLEILKTIHLLRKYLVLGNIYIFSRCRESI